MASDTTGKTGKTKGNAGGSATASGMNFQAAVTAIAGVHLISGNPLGWLDGLVDDTPVEVWAETHGPGDDIRLELRDKSIVEVQVKRRLRTGNKLWDSLMLLAQAINTQKISYGVLAVSPDTSDTIAYELPRDMRRLAEGRTDGLRSLAQTFRSKLETAGLPPQAVCERLRIQVVHGLDSDGASISAAKALLNSVVSDRQDVNAAWNRLYREADAIMERRGRWWKTADILRMFAAEGIGIADSNSPGAMLARLTKWVTDTNWSFSLVGVREPLSINEAWLPLKILARDFNSEPQSEAAEAMARYHAVGQNCAANRDAKTSDAEWIGRFYKRAVLIGGPGSGKSTLLTKIAHLYAKDGFPVLKVRLSDVAARMKSGRTFADSVFHLGLDGSGISPDEVVKTAFPDWILLCDGLDECHNQQEAVAEGLQRFASGHPQARIIVTTRPIGYSTTKMADWRHYELLPPDSSSDSEHLAKLIRAALPTTHKFYKNAPDIATTELKKCASPRVISRNPLLLGMAASLLANGGELGASKTGLYQNLFALIDRAPNPRPARQHMPRPVLTRMLDVLGWALVASPLDSEMSILECCADRLEVELDIPHLKSLKTAADCLRHWENVGLVEKVYHGLDALFTFIHKTFAEFTAARYLRDLKPEMQRAEIADRLDDPAWAEVLGFASGMGLAETIVSEAATGGEEGTIGRLELALSILADPGASVPLDLCQKIVGLAFNYVDSNQADEVFSLGCALAETAKTHPDLLGRAAASRLQSPQFPTRLIAWTCAAEAGAEYYDLDAASSAIHSLATELGKDSASSLPDEPVQLSREILLRGRKDRELLQRFALTFVRRILDIWPSETAGKYVMEIFKIKPLNTLGFHTKLEELYRSKGQKFELQTAIATASAKYMKSFQDDTKEFHRATCGTLRAIFSSFVLTEEVADEIDLEQSPALQLSAFLEIIGFENLSFSDMWAWTRPYDSEVVQEVLKTLVKISAIDEPVLAAEAKAMLNRMDKLPETNSFHVLSPAVSVDVPAPEWSAVKAMQVDRTRLEQALGHRSVWLVQAAANLLFSLGGTTEKKAKELLDNAHGYGLAAAAHLTQELEPATATELLLNRMKGPDAPGKHHLISRLNQLDPPWGERLEAVIQTGLMSSNVELVEESAALVLKYAESDVPVPPELLNEAFKHWITHEKPYPQNGGVVPYSPRATLLKGMLKLGAIDDERLMNLCCDTRPDVRKIATEALLKRVAVSDSVRATFVNETTAKALPASLLSQALVAKVPFSKIEVGRLSALLEDEDAKWRLASFKLLDPIYLELDIIRQTAEKLLVDPHPEIRQAAAQALNHAQALLK